MKVTKPIVLAISLLFIGLVAAHYTANAQNAKTGIRTVVIDAGHGGTDGGAVNRYFKEKDINLDVALRLGRLINDNYPDVKVVYTRKTDVLIPLMERGDIANRAGADLFISIHVNSAKSSSASGTETLVMGIDKAGKNLEVAMKENDVIVFEKDYQTNYQGYTPGSTESFIIFNLMQYSYQSQSIMLANMVQKHFCNQTKMINRGVKQAPVLVLWRTAMPSILAEFGFLSHPSEGRTIGTEKGREIYSKVLFNAFSEYKAYIEGRSNPLMVEVDSANEAETTENAAENSTETQIPQKSTTSAQTDEIQAVVYLVQVMSSDTKVAKNSTRFGSYRGYVIEKRINGSYKYYVGEAKTYQEALSLQTKVRKSISGAFIVAFDGEKQIALDAARAKTR